MQTKQRQYETTFVIDSFAKDEDIKSLITKIESFIKNNGGQIDKIEEWGKKRLAYEINRKQYGYYVHILFTAPSSLPDLLENEYRLEESLLRYLTVVTDTSASEPPTAKQPDPQTSAAEHKPSSEPTATESADEESPSSKEEDVEQKKETSPAE